MLGSTNSKTDARLPRWLLQLRIPILLGIHLVIFAGSWVISYLLRFDFDIPAPHQAAMWRTLPAALVIQLGAFWALRTLHGWWRYVTFRDLISLAKPLVLAFAILWLVNLTGLLPSIPRSVLIINLTLAGLLLSAVRSSWRLYSEAGKWLPETHRRPRTRALIISNHHDTLVLANQINSQQNSTTQIVGILTPDRYPRGASRGGIPILGAPQDAPRWAHEYKATQVWLVAGSIPGPELAELKKQFDAAGLETKVVPAAMDRNPGGSFIPVREIEINDLLQRQPVSLDTERIGHELAGKCVLVTGAGGSIGSEICRQVLRFAPRRLILLDHRENSVFLIHHELSRLPDLETELIPAVGDILDRERMESLFAEHQPDLVYHAAAHKHVGLMEITPGEAIKNNIVGTRQVAELAAEFGVTKFVLVSTDKAVNPTSIMGCTKQMAERCVLTLGQRVPTRFVVVRFGNVLGSNGSVVPLFKEQIARGGPLVITDPRMTRYFMTIPEASQLVIQAGAMGNGGEIFVLDMGEQVKIVDLAKKMIQLAGLPESAIEIRFSGARPGEKLFEELYFEEEQMVKTAHVKVFAAKHRILDHDEVTRSVAELIAAIPDGPDAIRSLLQKHIPEYTPSSGTVVAV